MEKKWVKIVLIVVCITLFVFFALVLMWPKFEKDSRARNYEEQAIENVHNYIYHKYGFEADVVSAKAEYKNKEEYFIDMQPTGYVDLVMIYKNKQFNVYIDGSAANEKGVDDYQKEKIDAALKELVNESCPNNYVDVKFYYGDNSKVEKYFDGDNIEDVLRIGNPQVVLSYIGDSLEGVQYFKNLSDDSRITILALSYVSKEKYDSISEKEKEKLFTSYTRFEDYSTCLSKVVRVFNSQKTVVYDFSNKVELDGFIVASEDPNADIQIRKLSSSEEKKYEAEDNSVAISNKYEIKTDTKTKIHIFVPENKISEDDHTKRIEVVSLENETEDVDYHYIYPHGEYYGTDIYIDEDETLIFWSSDYLGY